jgi:hypothetical protein
MTLSLHMEVDETWRQDWTPFSITVLDLRPKRIKLEGSSQPCDAVRTLHAWEDVPLRLGAHSFCQCSGVSRKRRVC